jgi:hypothetical protein
MMFLILAWVYVITWVFIILTNSILITKEGWYSMSRKHFLLALTMMVIPIVNTMALLGALCLWVVEETNYFEKWYAFWNSPLITKKEKK